MALERYRAFMSTQPDAKTAAQVQQVINTLEKEINGVAVAETETPDVPPSARDERIYRSAAHQCSLESR